MTMLASIKKVQLTARKNRDTVSASLLSTLIGDIERDLSRYEVKHRTDEIVNSTSLSTVKSFIKKNNEAQGLIKDQAAIATLVTEQKILTDLLPSQLTEAQLTVIVREAFESGAKTKSLIMKLLKENHNGSFDGKMAAQVVDKILAE